RRKSARRSGWQVELLPETLLIADGKRVGFDHVLYLLNPVMRPGRISQRQRHLRPDMSLGDPMIDVGLFARIQKRTRLLDLPHAQENGGAIVVRIPNDRPSVWSAASRAFSTSRSASRTSPMRT